jgi:hypothetical protein
VRRLTSLIPMAQVRDAPQSKAAAPLAADALSPH